MKDYFAISEVPIAIKLEHGSEYNWINDEVVYLVSVDNS